MMIQSTIVAIGLATLSCQGAEQKVLAGTLSPDKKIMIMEEQSDEGERAYSFARASDHQKLGNILPADQQGQISNIAILASWNTNTSKVALLIFYGNKLSELLLFTKDDSGQFKAVSWRQPDAEAIYQQRTGHRIPRPGDGHDENAIGPWEDENTVHLVSGQGTQTADPDHYTHLLATFKATFHGRKAVISALRLTGPLSDQADECFERQWGSRYFEGINE